MTGESTHNGDDDREDRRVGERLRARLALVEVPPPDLDRVVVQARRLRARRLAAALAVAAVVLAAGIIVPLTVLAPGGTDQQRPATPAPATGPRPATTQPRPAALPAPRPGWVWHRDAADRLAIQTPAAWHFSPGTGVGLVQPTALFIVGTGRLPAGGECAPTRAIKALPPDGALFWVIEYAGVGQDFNPYEFPPGPDRLELGPAASKECIGEPSHQLLFRQAGRYFQAEVLFGPAAPGSLRAAVVASLESLRPEPATDSLAEQCRRQWVFCPEAAWVFQVLNRAGLFHWGNTGSAIQAGLQDPKPKPTRKFDLWTTRGGPLPPAGFQQVAVVDGIAVYGDGDGRRLLWGVQGPARVGPGRAAALGAATRCDARQAGARLPGCPVRPQPPMSLRVSQPTHAAGDQGRDPHLPGRRRTTSRSMSMSTGSGTLPQHPRACRQPGFRCPLG